jgi:hypothetical protein
MFTIEPADHWRAGDRAYCIRGAKKLGRYVVETGRVYSVSEVKLIPGCMSDGLRLAEVDMIETWGFWSNRFVCIRGRDLPIRQITERTSRSWLDAYWATAKARAAQGMETRRADTPKSESVAKP